MVEQKYQKHTILTELSVYSKFYKDLAIGISHYVSLGVRKGGLGLDSYILSSVQGTIESIRMILMDGKINDAYALTRKYQDSVIINIYEILYLANNFSIEYFVVEKIDRWIHGSEKLPRYKDMISYIEKSDRLQSINKLLDLNIHQQIRDRCNDHTHYNIFMYLMMNDKQLYIENRREILDELSYDIRYIFIEHLIWLFSLSECYMASSDYIDFLDVGMTPPDGAQYLVAPYIQEIFDDVITKYRPDLVQELKNSTNMKLK
jgi:hypothetical protein